MVSSGMFNTSDAGPRSDGEATKRLRTKLSSKYRKWKTLRLQSGRQLLEFASIDFLRQILHGDPMVARQGEPGWQPDVEEQVRAALIHKPSLSEKAQKMLKSQAGKRFAPRKGYKTAPGGKDILADVEGTVPGTSQAGIKAGVFKQLKDIQMPPKAPEAPPPEMLPEHGKGVGYGELPASEGPQQIHGELWDYTEGAKPTEIKETLNLKPRKRRAWTPLEVSKRAEMHRDPIAGHLAAVKAGLTTSKLQKYEDKPRIPGVPSVRLPPGVESAEREKLQLTRDVLAGKVRAWRKNVQTPLRRAAGFAAPAPMAAGFWKGLPKTIGTREIPRAETVRRTMKPTTYIAPGLRFDPRVLKQFQGEFQGALNKRLAHHKKSAERIWTGIHKRVQAKLTGAEAQRPIEEAAMDRIKIAFSPNRREPIGPKEAYHIAKYTGHSPEEVYSLHKSFLRHTYLGESQAGEETLRRQILPKILSRVPGAVPPPPPPAVARAAKAAAYPLLKRTAIGAGVAGAVGAGAYIAHKLRQRSRQRMETQFSALGNLQQKLAGTDPGEQHPIHDIAAGTLEGAVTAPADIWVWNKLVPEGSSLLRKVGVGAGLGGITTGLVGSGLSRIFRGAKTIKQRKTEEAQSGQLSAILSEIHFQQDYTPPTPLHQQELHRWINYPVSRARAYEKGYGRVKKLARDIRAPKTAKGMVIDERGRERQPEWKKPWFKRTLIVGGLAATALTGRHLIGKLRETADVAKGLMAKGLPISPEESAAKNIVTGNVARAIGATFPKTTGAFSSASERAGGLGERFKAEVRGLRRAAAGKVSKFTESKVGEVGVKARKKGGKTVIDWDNPAAIKENVAAAQRIQARGEAMHKAGLAAEQRAKQAGTARGTMEAEIEALRKQREQPPEVKASSLLRLIRFQVPVEGYSRSGVQVRAHERGPRSPQPAYKQHKLLEGFLLGGGAVGIPTAAVVGSRYGYKHYFTPAGKEARARAYAERVAKRTAAREAEELAKIPAEVVKKVVPLIKHSSKLKEIRFQTDLAVTSTGRPPSRAMVARDRYMKQIHQGELTKANKFYLRSAGAGAALGAILRKKMPLHRAAALGALAGIGTQKVAREVAGTTKDIFGEESWTGKRIEKAPHLIGYGLAGGILAHRGYKALKKLSSKLGEIHFQEPERKHNVLAGLGIAAAGIPLYRGAGKFARIGLRSHIDKVALGKSAKNYGRVVADYLEGSQHILNQGITGKAIGTVLRHPEHPAVKWAIRHGPEAMGELGTASSGLNKLTREHFGAFRASHTEGLNAWMEEVTHSMIPAKSVKGRERLAALKKLDTHVTQTENLKSHLKDLWSQGYNEREALRHAANDPRHDNLFRRMAAFKAGPIKNYQKITAGVAAVPALAGAGVAATTRRNQDRLT